MTLQDILREAQALSTEERRELIKALVDTLAIENAEPEHAMHSIMEPRGLTRKSGGGSTPRSM